MRRLILGLLASAAVLVPLTPAAANTDEMQPLNVAVHVLNNDGGELAAADVELYLDGEPLTVGATYSTDDPDLAAQYADDAGEDVEVALISADLGPDGGTLSVNSRSNGDTYRTWISCDGELTEGWHRQMTSTGDPVQCDVLVDDLQVQPRAGVALDIDADGVLYSNFAVPALHVEGPAGQYNPVILGDNRFSHAGIYPSVEPSTFSAMPLPGSIATVSCTGGIKGTGETFDSFSEVPSTGAFRLITDADVSCALTYTQDPYVPTDITIRVQKSALTASGVAPSVDDFEFVVDGVARNDGDVFTIAADRVGGDAFFDLPTSTTPNSDAYEQWDLEHACFDTSTGLNFQVPANDQWDIHGPGFAWALSAYDTNDFTCSAILTPYDTGDEWLEMHITVLNNDGGSLRPHDGVVSVNGFTPGASYSGTSRGLTAAARSWSTTDIREPLAWTYTYPVVVEAGAKHDLVVDAPGYRSMIRCYGSDFALGEWVEATTLSTPSSFCYVVLDDVGESTTFSFDTAVHVRSTHGGELPVAQGGLMFNGQAISHGESTSVSWGTSIANLAPIEVDGFNARLSCHSNTEEVFDKPLVWVLYDESVQCDVLYSEPSLPTARIEAEIVNDNGGAMTESPVLVNGTAGIAELTGWRAHSFTLDAPTVDGYSNTDLTCVDERGFAVPIIDGQVELADAQHATCSVSYDDDAPAKISFATDLDPDTDPRLKFGPASLRPGQFRTRAAGDYIVAAHTLPGYNFTGTTCTAGSNEATAAPGEAVTIEPGLRYTCTYHFTVAATLTIDTTVNNNHGGTLAPDTAPVYLRGKQATGTFALSEGSHWIGAFSAPGYIKSPLTCVDDGTGASVPIAFHKITLQDGQSVTCSTSYTDRPAKVLFVSSFSSGQPDARFSFGSATLRGGQFRTRAAGDYTIGSRAVPGYTFSSARCAGGDGTVQDVVDGDAVSLLNGVLYTCTYFYDEAT